MRIFDTENSAQTTLSNPSDTGLYTQKTRAEKDTSGLKF